jgi:hypothetical protein
MGQPVKPKLRSPRLAGMSSHFPALCLSHSRVVVVWGGLKSKRVRQCSGSSSLQRNCCCEPAGQAKFITALERIVSSLFCKNKNCAALR